jgi:diguanylate cyclase
LRKGDVVARWGGEEFIMIFPQTIEEDVVDALQRLRLALAADIMTVAGPVAVRFSAGVATLDANEDLQSLVRRADSALYNAKAAGRNCTMVAAPGRTPRDLQAVSFDAPKLMAAV